MDLFKKTDEVYESADYMIRLKARITFILLLIFDSLYALTVLNLALRGIFNFYFWTFLPAEAALLYGTYRFLEGPYDLSTYIFAPEFSVPGASPPTSPVSFSSPFLSIS